MIRGLKQPSSLVGISMLCNVRLGLCMGWHVTFHMGIVSVGHGSNLWPKPNTLQFEALIWDKHYRPRLADFLTTHTKRITSCLSWRSIWHFVRHDIMRTMAWLLSEPYWFNTSSAWTQQPTGMHGMLSLGAWRDRDSAFMSSVVIVLKNGCTGPRRQL
jgi:hypothetical protein